MPGPPPNPNARRRNARQVRKLPAAGRQGPPPEWPLSGRKSKAIETLWEQLWSSPQAIAWEELGWTRVVARYTQKCIQAESPKAAVGLVNAVCALEDRLGLNPKSMKYLLWEIEPTPDEDETPAEVTRLDDYRDTFGAS